MRETANQDLIPDSVVNTLPSGVVDPTVKVVVNVRVGTLVERACTMLSVETERMTTATTLHVSAEEFKRFFATLLCARTHYASSEQVPQSIRFLSRQRRVPQPTFFASLLMQIGVAHDREYGYIFYPNYADDDKLMLSEEEFLAIESKLYSLEAAGLSVVHGLHREKEGDLDVMSTELSAQDRRIRSYRKEQHPKAAFHSAFFELVRETGVINDQRISYGSTEDYAGYVPAVVTKA